MRIAVNTRLLLKNKLEGIGWFTYETLKRIVQERREDEFIFIFDRNFDQDFIFGENVTPVKIGPPSRHPFLWYLWFEHSIPKVLDRFEPDLFLSPDGYLSLNSRVKQLAVIHDINFEHYPKDLPYLYRRYYRHFFPKYAQLADRIATVSEFSKRDISTQYHIDENKIDVVYNGVSDRFKLLSETQIASTKKQYANNLPYFVFVGSIHPRKNIARMLQAFDRFKSSGHHKHQLVIVGRKKWWTKNMESTLNNMQFKNEVHFHEQVSSQEVSHVVGASNGMLYVSTFEGFGIPIIEAMKSGIPVITSEVSSMPEIAADAALLCDPFDHKSIAEQMQRLVNVPGLSEDLIQKGSLRSSDFSWKNTADLLWQSIEKTI